MKFKKALSAIVLSAALALTGVPVCGIPAAVQAAQTNIEGLGAVLQQGYALYKAGDIATMFTVLENDTVKAYSEQVKSTGADRYVVDIDGNMKAMMYVDAEDGYWFYFGQMENGLRHGQGTTVSLASDGNSCATFSGNYTADFPNGLGKYSIVFLNSGTTFDISGNFQGAYMNGVYQVDASWLGNDGVPCASSLKTTYVNGRFTAVEGYSLILEPYDEYIGKDGNTYPAGVVYSFDYEGLEASYFYISGGQEIFAVGVDLKNGGGMSWSEESDDLNAGLNIFKGNGNAPAPVTTPAPTVPTVPTIPTVPTVPVTSITEQTTPEALDAVAREVLRGTWGVGKERKIRLEAAGYDYVTVQKKVYEIMQKMPQSAPINY